MVPRVYVDTSVIAGCLDREFRQQSERLRQAFASGLLRAVISDITIAELDLAPARVRDLLALPGFAEAERVDLDREADALAEEYILAAAVSESYPGPMPNTSPLPRSGAWKYWLAGISATS